MRAGELVVVGALVDRVPLLRPLLQEHLDDYDGVLPHLFLADVVRFISSELGSEVRSDVSGALEGLFRGGNEHDRELIAVSFLENLPQESKPGGSMRNELGPMLSAELRALGA